jgi:hypothetical protein
MLLLSVAVAVPSHNPQASREMTLLLAVPLLLCVRASRISVTFVSEKDGSETTVQVPIGQHLLEAAHRNDIELEGTCNVCATEH